MSFLFRFFQTIIISLLFFTSVPTTILNGTKTEIDQLPWYLEQINVAGAWEISKGLENITIAVIDSGIDFNHPELNHSSWLNSNEIPNNNIDDDLNGYIDDIHGWDFVNKDNNTGNDILDPIHYHGTFIAGIIASKHDDSGIVGISPEIKIMSLRIINFEKLLEDPGIFIEAIDYAVNNGAEVISTSIQMPLGIPGLRSSIQRAVEYNIPFVAATGNTYNSEGGGRNSVSFPAAYSESIAVGASNINYEKADYSNFGSTIELVAPVGDEDYKTRNQTIRSTELNSGFNYGYGTSYASPQVAAVIALMKSVRYNISVSDIRNILHSTAIDINETGWDEFTGYGIVNASAAVVRAKNYMLSTTKKNLPFPFPYMTHINQILCLIAILTLRSLKRLGRLKDLEKID